MPASEVVYLDGDRLERGETNDYTMDYATGEITFTPRVFVTDDKRIRVEFQYSTSQFTRSLVGSEVEAAFGDVGNGTPRGRLGLSVIREADGRDFSEEFGFSREDSLALARAGDGVASISGARRIEFDPEAPHVQYLREIRGGVDTVYVALERAPAHSVAVYRVRFTHVGRGKGSYERTGRSSNGILYEYRGPRRGQLPARSQGAQAEASSPARRTRSVRAIAGAGGVWGMGA